MIRSRATLGPVLAQVLRSTARRQGTRLLLGMLPPVAMYRRLTRFMRR